MLDENIKTNKKQATQGHIVLIKKQPRESFSATLDKEEHRPEEHLLLNDSARTTVVAARQLFRSRGCNKLCPISFSNP